MPTLHAIKTYRSDAYYHVYNRGARNCEVFLSASDYHVLRRMFRATIREQGNQVAILEFSLIPNHIHFLMKQYSERAISKLMQSVAIRYSMYLRQNYDHMGQVFQGRYKAAYLPTRRDVDRVRRYIRENAILAGLPADWPHQGQKI